MEAFGVNKRDAMNQIRQFGSKFDRLRNAAGGGGGGRNAPKRPKAAPNTASRKSNVFNEQVRYARHGALQDLKSTPLATFLTVMVIAISLTLPSVCYMVYKNVSSAASQYYPRRRSPFIWKKRWMTMPRRGWWASCRRSRASTR